MSELEKLIAEREIIREKDKQLTASIKLERARSAAAREATRKLGALAGVTVDEWKKLKSDNAQLRGIIAVLRKDSGVTYRWLGENMGCSPGRAKDIVGRALRQLRRSKWIDDTGA